MLNINCQTKYAMGGGFAGLLEERVFLNRFDENDD